MNRDFGEVTRKAAWSFGSRVVRRGALYATAILLGRLYGPAVMGTYFLFLAYTSVMAMLTKAGMATGLVKMAGIADVEGDRQRVSGLIRFALRMSFFLWLAPAFFLLLFPSVSARVLFHDSGEPVLSFLLAAAILAQAAMGLYESGFLALRRVKRASLLVQALQPATLFVLVAAAFLVTGPAAWVVPAAYVMSLGLPIVAFALSAKTLLPPPAPLDRPVRRAFIRLSVPLLFTSAMVFLVHWTDMVVLGQFRPTEQVGLYAAASRTAWLLPFLLQAFNAIVPTRTAQLFHEGRKKELEALLRKTARWSLMFALMLVSPMLVFPGELLSVFGRPFAQAGPLLLILAAGQLVNTACGTTSATLGMTGHEKALMGSAAAAAAVNLVLDLLLVPVYGATGAAVATAGSLILFNALRVFLSVRRAGIVPYATGIPGLLLQFGALTLVFALVADLVGVWALPFHVLGSAAVAAWALGKKDWQFLMGLVRSH